MFVVDDLKQHYKNDFLKIEGISEQMRGRRGCSDFRSLVYLMRTILLVFYLVAPIWVPYI